MIEKYYFNHRVLLENYKWNTITIPNAIKDAHNFLSFNYRKIPRTNTLRIEQYLYQNILNFNEFAYKKLQDLGNNNTNKNIKNLIKNNFNQKSYITIYSFFFLYIYCFTIYYMYWNFFMITVSINWHY